MMIITTRDNDDDISRFQGGAWRSDTSTIVEVSILDNDDDNDNNDDNDDDDDDYMAGS